LRVPWHVGCIRVQRLVETQIGEARMNTKSRGLKVKTGVRAGGFQLNHSRTSLKIRSGIKAGRGTFVRNHSVALLG
jgi:hypothetical protein